MTIIHVSTQHMILCVETLSGTGPDRQWPLCTVHLFLCWYVERRPSLVTAQGYFSQLDSMNSYDELQMDGSPNRPICWCCWQQAVLSAATCCYILTDVHPSPHLPSPRCSPSCSLSRWGISVSVSGCTDADPSLLGARRELMVISLLLPAPAASHTMTFCWGGGDQAPFVRPQVTPDPSALPPHTKLNPNSHFLMSRVQRHPPQAHFQTKTLVRWHWFNPVPFLFSLRSLCEVKPPAGH